MKKNWLYYLLAYGTWVIFILLGALFVILSRTALQVVLARYYVLGAFDRDMQAKLVDRVYLMALGFTWLILMILIEQYFRKGVQNGKTLVRIGRVLGPEVLLLAGVQLVYLILGGIQTLMWLSGGLLLIEFGIGFFLTWFGVSRKDAPPRPSAKV